MRQALAEGAPVVGACPYTDTDPLAHLDAVFAMARDFDVPIDMHLDFDLAPDTAMIEAVCARTEAAGWGGRVAIGHVTRLSALPPDRLAAALARMADAGVALTALPATDLFLMGREATHLVPRGVAPMLAARRAGVACSLSTNNVLNPFTPFGDGSALRIAHLYAHIAQTGGAEGMDACFRMVADEAAALIGRPPRRLEPGAPADVVVLAAASPAEAVATLAPAAFGFRAGRRSFTRPPVVLHEPK
jgi:cytosine deaminase